MKQNTERNVMDNNSKHRLSDYYYQATEKKEYEREPKREEGSHGSKNKKKSKSKGKSLSKSPEYRSGKKKGSSKSI